MYNQPVPLVDGTILKRIINVWGTAPDEMVSAAFNPQTQTIDLTKEDFNIGDFGPPFLDKANFSGPFGIENINIEITGARHNDFAYDPTAWNNNPFPAEAKVQEINRKTNLFMRALYGAVEGDQLVPGQLQIFLENLRSIGAASFEDGVWKINTDQLPY